MLNNNNGITLSGIGGPVMSGTWINPNNNDTFTVKDCFFEDNQLIVNTTDGRNLNYDILQNYIQADNKTINEMKEKPIQKAVVVDNGNIFEPKVKQDLNAAIIDKAMSDKPLPEFNVNIVWPKFPEKEIKLLHDVMNTDYDDIAAYFYNKIISRPENLEDEIRKQIKEFFIKEKPKAKPKTKKKK